MLFKDSISREMVSVEIEDGVVGRLDPDFAIALGDAFVLAGLELAAVEALPKFAIGRRIALFRPSPRNSPSRFRVNVTDGFPAWTRSTAAGAWRSMNYLRSLGTGEMSSMRCEADGRGPVENGYTHQPVPEERFNIA
jgi:hypothetical protein